MCGLANYFEVQESKVALWLPGHHSSLQMYPGSYLCSLLPKQPDTVALSYLGLFSLQTHTKGNFM